MDLVGIVYLFVTRFMITQSYWYNYDFSFFRQQHFWLYCPLLENTSLMVLIPRPVTYFKENLTFLKKSHLYQEFSIHFLKKNEELVYEGIFLMFLQAAIATFYVILS